MEELEFKTEEELEMFLIEEEQYYEMLDYVHMLHNEEHEYTQCFNNTYWLAKNGIIQGETL